MTEPHLARTGSVRSSAISPEWRSYFGKDPVERFSTSIASNRSRRSGIMCMLARNLAKQKSGCRSQSEPMPQCARVSAAGPESCRKSASCGTAQPGLGSQVEPGSVGKAAPWEKRRARRQVEDRQAAGPPRRFSSSNRILSASSRQVPVLVIGFSPGKS